MRSLLSALACLLLCGPAAAHEGPAAALDRLDRQVEEAPQDLETLLRRAEARRRAGRHSEALQDLDVASRLSPDEPRVHAERGLTLHAAGAEGAEAALDRYLEAVPDAPRVAALAARADILLKTGRAAAALVDLDAAISVAPNPDLCARRGEVHEGMGRFIAAAAGYRSCAAMLSGAVVLRLEAVRAERSAGRPDVALVDLEALLSERPRHPAWIILRSDLLDEVGREEEARLERRRALGLVEGRLARRNSARLRAWREALLASLGSEP